jgi:BirA family biotin operon repressor/biotin-[acetyl-CoA-carboxylase] ligase
MYHHRRISEGDIVIAEYQTAGRGQRNNVWESAPGKNLTFSLLLTPGFLYTSEQFFLNIFISLAIRDFLAEYLPENPHIKWPNDVYYSEKKICGILIESNIKNNAIQSSVIGIGINVNQEDFAHDNAVSMAQICGQTFDREELLKTLAEKIETRYLQLEKGNHALLQQNYLQHLYWMGEPHTFWAGNYFEGTIAGLNEWGQLGVKRQDNIIQYFDFKEIMFIK